MSKKGSAEKTIRNIRRKTGRLYSSEEKIRIVLEGLRGRGGGESIAMLCRREGIADSLYYSWSKGVSGSRQEAPGRRYGTPGHLQ
ncbi:MAG: transposase [Alphaproteobacteria bacterium]